MNKKELLDWICDIFGIEKCNEMILKQINKYVTERGYNYKDIARALTYYVDVKNNKPDIKYGIGIVPYVIDEARAYYENLKRIKEEQMRAAELEKKRQLNQIENKGIFIQLSKKKTIHKKTINIDKL